MEEHRNRTGKGYEDDCLVQNSPEVIRGLGKNIIPPPEKEILWKKYLEKFEDPIILILLVVLVFSVMVSVYEIICLGKPVSSLIEPAGIFMAILLATGIGFIFEVRAEKEFRVLNKVKDDRLVRVIRKTEAGGEIRLFEIHRCDVCIGDAVQLESGDEIPADSVVVEAVNLRVDESAFTGELYADKFCEIPPDKSDATYPANLLLRGSTVIDGYCVCKVTAIGIETEEGRGSKLLQEDSEVETPLTQQLNRLGKLITRISYIVAGLIVAGRLIVFFFAGGYSAADATVLQILEYLLHSVMTAVTLIVVAVPEGLPMSVTISLALSMRKMLKEKNLVRKLHACETMGAATVICTDKTGTLTENKMKVAQNCFVGSEDLIYRSIAANSTAALAEDDNGNLKVIGNPTEGALLRWMLEERGINYLGLRNDCVVTGRKSFSSLTKMMETVIEDYDNPGLQIRFIKGAPEIVLSQCKSFIDISEEEVRNKLELWQRRAMRTLAFAFQTIYPDATTGPVTFSGIVGIADPVRSDVKEAIDICRGRAGVRVIVVTGDVSITANEIGRELGLISEDEQTRTITGPEFASLSDSQAMEILPQLRILSRARPEDKARLVTLLQKMGEVVAVTGDGTNDAPALKKAQVGLSMGDGTARAKEASDITIIDNSFSSINKGLLWGRSIYLNIKRFILFQMTINVSACLIVLFGSFVGMESPLTVTQMLWVNLIMDTFAAMALSSLPADPRVMYDRPRSSKSHIIDRKMGIHIVGMGFFFFCFLALFWQLLRYLDIVSVKEILSVGSSPSLLCGIFAGHHANDLMTEYEKGVFFTVFVVLQFWNLFNCRFFRTGRSLMGGTVSLISNPREGKKLIGKGFVIIALVILAGQFLIVNCCGPVFNVEALSLEDWGLILILTSPVLVVPDIVRMVRQINLKKLGRLVH